MGDSAGAAAGLAAAVLNVVVQVTDAHVAEMSTFLVSTTALTLAATDIRHFDAGKEAR
jgi:hypothetical protein